MEATSQFSIRTFKGRFISDHRVVTAELSIGIQHIMGKTVTFRNLKRINVDEFESTLDLGHTENMRDLELVNRTYQEELSRVLNHLAPEITIVITRKEKRPWFDKDISNLKESTEKIRKNLDENQIRKQLECLQAK